MRWLLLVFSLLFFFPLRAFAHEETTTIAITGNGFEPANALFHQGSKVLFLNRDTRAHWPASDPHPTHEIYPEFDPKRTIAPGDVWGFTFERVGKFGFHDHLNPHVRGVIEVVAEQGSQARTKPPEKPIWLTFWEKITAFFYREPKGEDFKKLGDQEKFSTLEKMANSKGAKRVWQYLLTTYHGESGSSGNIHDLAHLAGKLFFDKDSWPGLTSCSVTFAFGCYHGFLDQAFVDDLDRLGQAEIICAGFGSRESGPYGSCVHGIGHGVASFYRTTDLKSALESCRTLPSAGVNFCTDGVFMEFARNTGENFYKSNDPLTVCQNYPVLAHSCGRNLPTVLLSRQDKTKAETVSICSQQSANTAQGCFDALAFMIAGESGGQAQKVVAGCQIFSDKKLAADCLTKAAGELVFQEAPNYREQSWLVCDALSGNEKNSCRDYVASLFRAYNRPF